MKKHTLVKIFAAGLGIAMLLTGCPNDTTPPSDPKCECPEGTIHAEGETCCEGDNCNCGITPPPPVVCECPNGTIHAPNETCCEGTDCNCKKWQVLILDNINGHTVTIEDKTGVSDKLDVIESAISILSSYITNDIKIIVESGNSYIGIINPSNNTYAMHTDWLSSESNFAYHLENAFIDHPIISKANVFNPNIRLALASGKGMKTADRQASFAYVAYQNG
jgi:hypothetical protein